MAVLDIWEIFPSYSDDQFFEEDFIFNREIHGENLYLYSVLVSLGALSEHDDNALNHFSSFPRLRKGCIHA